MVIPAHFETQPRGTPRGARRTLRLEALGSTAANDPARVLVHNISATGLLLESAAPLAIGETIAIDLPHAGATPARAVWTSGNLVGCQFDAPLSPAALTAAQLRSAAAEGAVPDRSLLPDESFGMRLQRLRKQRGLSLDQLAVRLGVSKPAVWGWEQGRSRPAEKRLEALVEALGVPRSELVPGRPTPGALGGVLGRAREQIALAAGTSPDRIRIMIEL